MVILFTVVRSFATVKPRLIHPLLSSYNVPVPHQQQQHPDRPGYETSYQCFSELSLMNLSVEFILHFRSILIILYTYIRKLYEFLSDEFATY